MFGPTSTLQRDNNSKQPVIQARQSDSWRPAVALNPCWNLRTAQSILTCTADGLCCLRLRHFDQREMHIRNPSFFQSRIRLCQYTTGDLPSEWPRSSGLTTSHTLRRASCQHLSSPCLWYLLCVSRSSVDLSWQRTVNANFTSRLLRVRLRLNFDNTDIYLIILEFLERMNSVFVSVHVDGLFTFINHLTHSRPHTTCDSWMHPCDQSILLILLWPLVWCGFGECIKNCFSGQHGRRKKRRKESSAKEGREKKDGKSRKHGDKRGDRAASHGAEEGMDIFWRGVYSVVQTRTLSCKVKLSLSLALFPSSSLSACTFHFCTENTCLQALVTDARTHSRWLKVATKQICI